MALGIAGSPTTDELADWAAAPGLVDESIGLLTPGVNCPPGVLKDDSFVISVFTVAIPFQSKVAGRNPNRF